MPVTSLCTQKYFFGLVSCSFIKSPVAPFAASATCGGANIGGNPPSVRPDTQSVCPNVHIVLFSWSKLLLNISHLACDTAKHSRVRPASPVG